ncbi:hypothetical protein KP509_24G004400 [Ceratopteris richardii]|nr:hypothetical protein KP509_24G004400 [Ceratopteris richardii]
MHYVDFPDEKANFMKAYQHDPSGKKKKMLMVRPSYPPIYMATDESIIQTGNGPVVVVNGNWSIGDHVDWYADGCFWIARITAIFSKESVQVELLNAPFGEGGSYEAPVKDIRPSLDWSIDRMWTVPSMKEPGGVPIREPNFSLSGVDNLEPVKRKYGLPSSVFENVKDSDTWHASSWSSEMVIDELSQAIPPKDDLAMKTINTQKSEASDYTRVTILSTDHLSPSNSSKQEQASNDCNGQEQKSQLDVKVMETCQTFDLDDKTSLKQKALDIVSSNNVTGFDAGELHILEDFYTFLEDKKHLDLTDEKLGSSIVALEELISRVAWLKGVMQLGLKGWCEDRRKRKWAFCERKDAVKSDNDTV